MTGQVLYVLIFLTSLSSAFNASVEEKPVDGIRIAWDYSTRRLLSSPDAKYSGYARMIVLRDNSLFCVFESQGSTYSTKSNDGGNTWSAANLIAARENEIARVVPEILQLEDNSLLVSYNLRPQGKNTDPTKRFGIEVKRSTDVGNTWSDPIEVYKAGHKFINGCWEPAQIQLASGEIQLYIANEAPYKETNEQEITMFRSGDNGSTWSKGETLSFRKGFRDGMPVPLILKNKKEIVYAIEDNGIEGLAFKPVIIRTPLDDNWKNAPVLSTSQDRHHAMDINNRIPGPKYAGAPYIRQLPSGETILSYQGNEWRNGNKWDVSDMIVAIGSDEARDFNRKSPPFFFTDTTKTCLWNSLTVLNDTTVIALASTNGYSEHTGVWMIKGRVLKEPKAMHYKPKVDDAMRNKYAALFVGGYGATQANINFAWDDNSFFITADVIDNDVTTDDGLKFYIDAKRVAPAVPTEVVFSFDVTAVGKVMAMKGKSGSWTPSNAKRTKAVVKRTGQGYRIEMQIPWTECGGRLLIERPLGFHAVLKERSKSGRGYDEPLSGNQKDVPYTWSPVHLTN